MRQSRVECATPGCKAPPLRDGNLCIFHDQRPQYAEMRQAARRKGGSNSRKREGLDIEAPRDATEAAAVLARALSALLRGDIDPRTAQSVASLSNTLLRAVQVGELEARLRELEGERDAG